MKAKIDIVTGFLESGKTTIINRLLEECSLGNRKILVIQYELGNSDISETHLRDERTIYKYIEHNPRVEELVEAITKHKPTNIVIEYNGIYELEALLVCLEDRRLRKLAKVNSIINVINGETFDNYYSNLGNVLVEPLSKSDYLLITGAKELTSNKKSSLKSTLKELNSGALIYEIQDVQNIEEELLSDIAIEPPMGRSIGWKLDYVFISFLFVVFLYIARLMLKTVVALEIKVDISALLVFNTVFISILMQTFPFILIGVLVSAIIQIYVSQEMIDKVFNRNKFLAIIIAVFAGVLFPVCDCAIIPVMRRLVKKGVPLSAAVTFMLTAPIVDPIVIASTFYAFPINYEIAIIRIVLGVFIAVSVGLIFSLIQDNKNILNNRQVLDNCQCQYCNTDNSKAMSMFSKVSKVISHAVSEFFEVGKYLIVAAAVSSLLKTVVSGETMDFFSRSPLGSLVTVMIAAFVLSICSTSDAFIARNFLNQFGTGPVIGFMVFGAMLDIKNLMMLIGSFKKKFVTKLVLTIAIISFVVLLAFTYYF